MSNIDPIETARELATHASNIEHLQEDMDKMRRARAMAGGKTILTSEGMPSRGKTLLG